jgi:ATP-binding cassette subfamily B protein
VLARVRIVRQFASEECGIACLEMVLRYYGARPSRGELRGTGSAARDGMTALSIVEIARQFGLDAEGFSVDVDSLSRMPTPAILHFRRGHFVVLEGVEDGFAHIVDPAVGRLSLTLFELKRSYSGVAIGLEGISVKRASRSYEALREVSSFLRPAWLALIASVLISALLATMLVGAAQAFGIVIDESGTAWNLAFQSMEFRLLLLLTAYATLNIVLVRLGMYCNDLISSRVAGQFTCAMSSVDITYLEARSIGDLRHRMIDVDAASAPFGFAPIGLLGLPCCLFYTAVIVKTSIAAAVALGAGEFCLMAATLLSVLRDSQRVPRTARLRRREQKLFQRIVQKAVDLRALGAQTTGFAEWHRLRRELSEETLGERFAGEILGRADAPQLFGMMIAVTGLVAVRVRAGGASLGQGAGAIMLGFAAITSLVVGLRAAASAPAWIRALRRADDLRGSSSRQHDSSGTIVGMTGARPPDVVLEAREVTLRWGASQAVQLLSIDLIIRQAEAVAIVGSPGAGKTALAQILMGIRLPSSGRVELAGHDIRTYSEIERRSLISGILDSATLVDGTVYENLRLGNWDAGEFEIRRACELVGIETTVASLPLGYATPLHDTLSTINRGLHDRLLLARTLLSNSRIVVIDSLLDDVESATIATLASELTRTGRTLVVCTNSSAFVDDRFRVYTLKHGRLMPASRASI